MKTRNYGIDLLRIISIFCVVVLHTLYRSTLLQSEIESQYNVAWLMESAAYFAVDAFGMISGFVNYSETYKRTKLSNLIELWLQVVFYGVCIVAICVFFTPIDVERSDAVVAMFPLIKGEYWFFSAYAGMLLLSNIVNTAVRNTDDKILVRNMALLLIVIIVLESISVKTNDSYSLFDFERGYNCFWLLTMYFIGATVRKTGLHSRFKNRSKTCCLLVVILVLFSWVWKIEIGQKMAGVIPFGNNWERLFLEYISPTIVAVAFLLLIIFANIKFSAGVEKTISMFSASVFSVYLLNSQPLIASHLWNQKNLSFLLTLNNFKLVGAVLLSCILFVVACLIIDKIRVLLFKALRVKSFTKIIEEKIYVAADKVLNIP